MGWKYHVDEINIKAFLGEARSDNEHHNTSVKSKRGRSIEEDDVYQPT